MRFYTLLGLSVIGLIGGAALLVLGFQASESLSSGEMQLSLLHRGVVMNPFEIEQTRSNIMGLMIGGAALMALGFILSIIALATRPKT